MSETMTTPLGRSVASVRPLAKQMGDCIPEERLAEIARRLLVSIETELLSDVVRSENEPQDKSKLWFKPSTGKLYVWNFSTNKWQETQSIYDICLSGITDNLIHKDDNGCIFARISRSEENLLEVDEEGNLLMRNISRAERFDSTLVSDGSGNGEVTMTITKFADSSAGISLAWLTDPGKDARWWIDDQQPTTVTIKFAGLANATSYGIAVTATQTEVTP